MAGEDEDVRTALKLVDQSSAPLAKIAQSFDDVARKASSAQAAAAGFSKLSRAQPTGYAAAAKVWGQSPAALAAGARMPEKVRRAAEEGETPETREGAQLEMRQRRERVKLLRFEEQRGQIADRSIAAAASLLGAENVAASKLGVLSNAFDSVGFQMVAMGGKSASIGTKLVQLAGPIAAAGAALAAGYALGEAADEFARQFTTGGKSLSEWLVGLPSPQEISQQNEQYARSLGFSSTQHMNDAMQLTQKVQQERKLQEQIQRYANQLPIIPAERTGRAMETAEIAAMTLAKKITPIGGDIKQAYEMVMSAGENTARSWQVGADRQADFNALVEQASKSVLAYGPPLDASSSEVKEFNSRLRTLADAATNSGLSLNQVPAFIEALKQKIEGVGTVTNVLMEMQKTVEASENLNNAMRGLHLPLRRAGESFELLRLRALRDVQERAAREGWSPELARAVAEKQFSKIDMQKAQLNVDFRNSRFDIKQNFAEGFDPDRIAVAFTQDLVSLGDRRLQSAHAPIYGSK